MVPTKNECVNAALAELEKVGIRNVEIARGSKHPQLRFQINGIPRIFGVSGTPSDWRTPANTARDVRKLLRQHGITTAPDPRPAAPPPRQLSRVELLEQRVAALERAVFSNNTPVKEAGTHE
jgi:hypothetical protein